MVLVFSCQPRPEILWEKQCAAGQFEETSYHVASIGGLWWHDSVAGESAPGRTSRIWQIHIDVDPNDAFLQEGLPTKPQIYWLVVDVETVDGEFGWSTRQWPDHFGDGAVWGTGLRLALAWNETFYPHGHSYYDIERNSVDMAFCLLFHAEGFARATCEPTSVTQCPALSTRCPPAPTQCPAAQTSCPAGSTQCPASRTCCPVMQTVCPVAQTQCPGSHTQCPM